ncbi:MAG: TRAP transporter small permease subunit [Pseudomonadota bacterium]
MSVSADEVVSISDPSEVDRETHNRGDRLIAGIGNALAWLFPTLMMVIVIQVFLRNFGRIGVGPGNQAWLDDMQWWLYGIACLVGVAYAVTTNSHVRVDIFYDAYEPPKQRRVDLFALGWLFIPFCLICWDLTFHYAVSSVQAWEGSSSPNGLHNLWILKVLMNLSFIVIAGAAWARLVRLLGQHGHDTGWDRFKWSLPSVALAVNLVLFYAMWWLTRVVDPEMAPRAIMRNGLLMGEVEFGPYETNLTVLVALAITAALGALLYVRKAR